MQRVAEQVLVHVREDIPRDVQLHDELRVTERKRNDRNEGEHVEMGRTVGQGAMCRHEIQLGSRKRQMGQEWGYLQENGEIIPELVVDASDVVLIHQYRTNDKRAGFRSVQLADTRDIALGALRCYSCCCSVLASATRGSCTRAPGRGRFPWKAHTRKTRWRRTPLERKGASSARKGPPALPPSTRPPPSSAPE